MNSNADTLHGTLGWTTRTKFQRSVCCFLPRFIVGVDNLKFVSLFFPNFPPNFLDIWASGQTSREIQLKILFPRDNLGLILVYVFISLHKVQELNMQDSFPHHKVPTEDSPFSILTQINWLQQELYWNLLRLLKIDCVFCISALVQLSRLEWKKCTIEYACAFSGVCDVLSPSHKGF